MDSRVSYLKTKVESPERSRRIFFTDFERSRETVTNFTNMLYNTLQGSYYVYIILCNDDSYYTGLTDDLMRRFEEHVNGIYESCYTYKRRPLILKYYETIPFKRCCGKRNTN